jgi:hypothetical protein
MKQLMCLVVLGSLALPAAADWNSSLSGGRGDVTIHEDNRATIRQGGVERPLWDGTHRLEDGSTLIIRRGIAVPKVCGPENECLDTEVCPAVSQLVDREWEERRASHNRGYMTPTSGQCMQALDDTEFFVKCPIETSPD